MKIVVGMSGGVDSAVSALLLAREGHEVVGVFMKNWEEQGQDGVCAATKEYEDVQATCDAIGIPYYTVNFSREYYDRVFSYFLSEYEKGRTPNPDVLCNREIKFQSFLDFSKSLGAGRVATGHFANLSKEADGFHLMRGIDAAKDQSYFLYMLTQKPLSMAMFPVGRLTKSEVRDIAERARLPVAQKKDSTGICFIGERKFRTFLQGFLPTQPGEIILSDGTAVGRHEGLMYYTLGQRKGLGIGGRKDGEGRFFVVAKDLPNNRLIVERGKDSPLLYSTECAADNATWVLGRPPSDSFDCTAKYRYRQPDQRVHVEVCGSDLFITAMEPQRAVTPGQSVVLYRGEDCLGGAVVDSVQRKERNDRHNVWKGTCQKHL